MRSPSPRRGCRPLSGLMPSAHGYKIHNVDASRFLRISKSLSRKNAEIQVGGDPIDRELATDFLSSQRNPWPAKNNQES